MKRLTVFFCTMFFLALPLGAQAQDYGRQSIDYCLMQLGKGNYRYADKSEDNHLGPYQFDVNALFDAGVCTGQAPAIRTTDWNYCDFRGLVAVDNFVQKADDILGRGDTQDLYMDLIQQKIMERHRDFFNSDKVKSQLKYDNSKVMLSAMIYRKGFKATQLYMLTDISALDKQRISLRDYWDSLQHCAGGNRPRDMAQPLPKHPIADMNFKVPLEFNWKPVDGAAVKTIESYRKKPLDVIDEVIAAGTLDGLLYDTIDLNGDGVPGMQFMLNNPYYCGTGGCMYVVTENNGALSLNTTTTRIRPAVNGVYVNGVYNSF